MRRFFMVIRFINHSNKRSQQQKQIKLNFKWITVLKVLGLYIPKWIDQLLFEKYQNENTDDLFSEESVTIVLIKSIIILIL